MWSLLGLLGIGAYAAGKQVKYNHDIKKDELKSQRSAYMTMIIFKTSSTLVF